MQKGDFSMRRFAIALALSCLAASAYAGNHTYTSIGDDADDCTSRQFRFNSRPGQVSKETIEAGNVRTLRVNTDRSPVAVTGRSGRGYTIVVCKAAELAEDLDDIHVSVQDGELRATGPSHDDWTVVYHVYAPNGGSVDLETRNGPVSVRDFDGNVVARLANGPLSLHNVGGNVDAVTKNGPISINGGSGTMKVRATNGPLSVNLGGSSFNGTLDATTQNGPLSVTVPENFNSGVTVELRGHGPISCRAARCGAFRGTTLNGDDDNDRPRIIDLGNGPTNVRLSTVNGPVTIRESSSRD